MASKAKVAKPRTTSKASTAKKDSAVTSTAPAETGETVVLTPRPAAPKPVAVAPAAPIARIAGASTSGTGTAGSEDTALKLKELVTEAVARSGAKKRDVKPAVEAAVAILAEALEAERDVRLPGFGKLRVVKTGGAEGGPKVLTLKLRRPGPG